MNFRNQKRNAQAGVDVEINHPELGWIPHTVAAGSDLETAVTAAGGIAAYVAPAPVEQPAPDIEAAIRALIIGDTTAALAAIDKTVMK